MSLNNKIGIKLTQMYMISPIDMDNKSIGHKALSSFSESCQYIDVT